MKNRYDVNSAAQRLGYLLLSLGLDPRKTLRALRSLKYFAQTYGKYRRMSRGEKILLAPILGEHLETAGSLSSEYFAIDLWAARVVHRLSPSTHLDVGSRVDGFIGHVLSWGSIDVLDVRPLASEVDGMRFILGDGRNIETVADDTYDLVSSIHAIEHFGLGRYGDEVDPLGHLSAIDAMIRVIKNGGHLVLALPVGNGVTQFNAQRLVKLEDVLQRIPGTVIELVETVGDGAVRAIQAQPNKSYSCVGIVIKVNKILN
jgi:SAM-dependent methyltransferase